MDACLNCVFIESESPPLLHHDPIAYPPGTNEIKGSFIHKAIHVLMDPMTCDDTKVKVTQELQSYLKTQYMKGDSFNCKDYNAILVVLPHELHILSPNDHKQRGSIIQALTMRAKYVQPPMLNPVDIKYCRMREERLGLYYDGMLMVSAPFDTIAQLLDYLDPQ